MRISLTMAVVVRKIRGDLARGMSQMSEGGGEVWGHVVRDSVRREAGRE